MSNHQQVILVDDDRIFCQIATVLIKKVSPGASITVFEDPEEALKFFSKKNKSRNPYVVFVDINMPKMTGWELLERLGMLPAEMLQLYTFYIVTSSEYPDDIELARKHPLVTGYYSKPISVDAVKTIISAMALNNNRA